MNVCGRLGVSITIKNDIPSKAACTLRLRLCVASNALAVAADDGGLVPLMLAVTAGNNLQICQDHGECIDGKIFTKTSKYSPGYTGEVNG